MATGTASTHHPKMSRNTVIQCPVCLDTINEPNRKNKKGHDAIFFDGLCKEWIHRQCVGLSIVHFEKLAKSNNPFLCPKCTIHNQSIAIKTLSSHTQGLFHRICNNVSCVVLGKEFSLKASVLKLPIFTQDMNCITYVHVWYHCAITWQKVTCSCKMSDRCQFSLYILYYLSIQCRKSSP